MRCIKCLYLFLLLPTLAWADGAATIPANPSTPTISTGGAPVGGFLQANPLTTSKVQCAGGNMGNGAATTGGTNCLIEVVQEDSQGYAFWVGSPTRPFFQIRRDGGHRIWDYLIIWPFSSNPFGGWTGGIDTSMFAIGSDLTGSNSVDIALYSNQTSNHELIRGYGSVTYDGGGLPSGTLKFDVDGAGRTMLGSATFANLTCSASFPCAPNGATTGSPPNGTTVYCSDCDPTATLLACTHVGAQTGAFAYRVNGAWKCMG